MGWIHSVGVAGRARERDKGGLVKKFVFEDFIQSLLTFVYNNPRFIIFVF